MGILRTDKISGLETPTAVTGSVFFDGSGDYLQTPDSEIFSLEKNDYTIEGWFYFTTLSATQRLFGQRASNASERQMLMETNASGELTYYFDISNSPKTVGGVVATRINTWHHIAVVRKNLVHTLYVDGVSVATNSTDTGTLNNRSQPFSIGRQGDYTSDAFNGHISNFRICKGTAVYTSDFTVPTHALEVTQDTVLLCCNNPDSVTASDHGTVGAAPPTLTANGDPTVSSINPGLTRDFTGGTEFKGVTTFDTQGYFVPPSGTTEQRGGTRGLRMGGNSASNVIEYYDISTTGNTQDFGDLSFTIKANAACSSSTRALSAGGEISGSGNTNHIDFVSIMSTGNAVTFGDLDPNSLDISHMVGVSNGTRGVFSGGYGSPGPFAHSDHMAFVTIAALGNGQDFGDLNYSNTNAGSFSSPTRGVIGGGQNPGFVNTIGFITIATTGSAQNFGDLTVARRTLVGGSNSVRGIFAGGQDTSPNADANSVKTIDYVTIASTGNAQDFGELSGKRHLMSAGTSSTRCVWPGGKSGSGTANNTMEYVTIASTGDAVDFGDTITSGRFGPGGCSNGHGGIS